MSRVLVLDAQTRNSLAVIRSLGKKGIEVTACEDTKFATAFYSKYCVKRVVYPSPEHDLEYFINYMLNLVKKENYEVIFPITDKTAVPICKYKKEFSEYTIVPLPNYPTLMKARDKAQTLKIAMENNIPCPKTYFVDTSKDVEKIKNKIEYPVIIKPREGHGARGMALCKTEEELILKYNEIYRVYGSSLIQEYIPYGDEIGVYALFNNSEPRAVCVQKRLRSYPVNGGPSTLRISIKAHELVNISFKLLKAMNWSGVAMVEFRVDPRDNIPKLMEVNPRFWGSLQLSILSGVDYPYLLYKMVTEGDVEPVLDYKDGVKCRWLLPGDILWFFSAPNKLENLPAFLKFNDVDGYDIISLEDLGAAFGFILATLQYFFDKKKWRYIVKRGF